MQNTLIHRACFEENVTAAFAGLRKALQLPERDAIDIPEQREWRRMRDPQRLDAIGHWLRAEAMASFDSEPVVFVPIGGAAYAKQND